MRWACSIALTGPHHPAGHTVGWSTVSQHQSPPDLLRLQGLLTLFAESFASFNHSTCALSVPCQVCHLVMDTHHTSNCSPKPLYSWMPTATPGRPQHTAPYGTVSLCCGPFQVTPWCMAKPRHSCQLRCPQHLLKPTRAECTVCSWDSLRADRCCPFIRHYCSNRCCLPFHH